MKHFDTLEQEFLYYANCQVATLSKLGNTKKTSTSELCRQARICHGMLFTALRFGLHAAYKKEYDEVKSHFDHVLDECNLAIEQWVFTQDELKNPKRCRGDDEFFASCSYTDAPELETWRERGILVYRNGKATNRYGDGTAGISEKERELVEDEETLHALTGDEYADAWRTVISKNEKFLQIVE